MVTKIIDFRNKKMLIVKSMLKYIAISRMKEGAKVKKLLLVVVGGVGEGKLFFSHPEYSFCSQYSKCKCRNELRGLH